MDSVLCIGHGMLGYTCGIHQRPRFCALVALITSEHSVLLNVEILRAAMDIKRIRIFLEEIGMRVTEPTLCDQNNQLTIKLQKAPKQQERPRSSS